MKKILLIIALSVSTLGFYSKSFAANVLPDLYIGGAVVHQNLDHSIDSIVFTICNSGGYFKAKGVAIRLDFTVDANVANQNGLEFYRDLSIRTSYCTGVTIEGEEVLQGRQLPVIGKVNSGLASVYTDRQESSLSNNTSTGVEVYYTNKTNSVNLKDIQDKYYGLTKEIYYKLNQTGKISDSEYKSLLQEAYNDIYNANSTPEKIYNYALELEKKYNDIGKYSDILKKIKVLNSQGIITKDELNKTLSLFEGYFSQGIDQNEIIGYAESYVKDANFKYRNNGMNQLELFDMINKLLNQWVNEGKIDQNTYQTEYNHYNRKIFKEDKNEKIYKNFINSKLYLDAQKNYDTIYNNSTQSSSVIGTVNTTQRRIQAIYAELYSLGYITETQYNQFMKKVELTKNMRQELRTAQKLKGYLLVSLDIDHISIL